MEHYNKVQKQREETAENEIRVAAGGQVSKYLGYAFRILNRSTFKHISIRATGNAIVKALILIELVKRRIGNLHQLNKIHSMMIIDKYEPKMEGLEPIEQARRVTAFDCILSTEPLDTEDPGYQVPKEAEERQPSRAPKRKEHQHNNNNTNQHPSQHPAAAGGDRGADRGVIRGNRGRGRGDERGGRGRGGQPRRYNDDTDVAADTRAARGRKTQFNEEIRANVPPRGRGEDRGGSRARGRGRGHPGPSYNDRDQVQTEQEPRREERPQRRPRPEASAAVEGGVNEMMMPQRGRGEMRGMRGNRGGAYPTPAMRSRDDFYVAPSRYNMDLSQQVGYYEGDPEYAPPMRRGRGEMRGRPRGAYGDRPPQQSRYEQEQFERPQHYGGGAQDRYYNGPPSRGGYDRGMYQGGGGPRERSEYNMHDEQSQHYEPRGGRGGPLRGRGRGDYEMRGGYAPMSQQHQYQGGHHQGGGGQHHQQQRAPGYGQDRYPPRGEMDSYQHQHQHQHHQHQPQQHQLHHPEGEQRMRGGGGELGRGARPMPYEPIVSAEIQSSDMRYGEGQMPSNRGAPGGHHNMVGVRMRGGRGGRGDEMRMRGRGGFEGGDRGGRGMPRGGAAFDGERVDRGEFRGGDRGGRGGQFQGGERGVYYADSSRGGGAASQRGGAGPGPTRGEYRGRGRGGM